MSQCIIEGVRSSPNMTGCGRVLGVDGSDCKDRQEVALGVSLVSLCSLSIQDFSSGRVREIILFPFQLYSNSA